MPRASGTRVDGEDVSAHTPARETLQQRRQRVYSENHAANSNLRPVATRRGVADKDEEMRSAKLELIRSETALNNARERVLLRQLQRDDGGDGCC